MLERVQSIIEPSQEYKEQEPYKDVAIIGPGQGGQEVGMGLDIIKEPAAQEIFFRADLTFQKLYKHRLTPYMFYGPETSLNTTTITQPSLVTDGIANYAVGLAHKKEGFKKRPTFTAGNSLGEYTAAIVAGAISFEDGLKLVSERGRLMQKACDKIPTGMVPIRGETPEQLQEFLSAFKDFNVCLYNTHEQTIIGGPNSRLEEASDWLKNNFRIRAGRKLNTAGAFHSQYMTPIKDEFAKILDQVEFEDPDVPIVANMTAKPLYTGNALKNEFFNQIDTTVNWRGIVQYLNDHDIDHRYTLGPKDTYSKMDKTMSGGEITAVAVGAAGAAVVAYEWFRHHSHHL